MPSPPQPNSTYYSEENRINSYIGNDWTPLTALFYYLARDGFYRIEGTAEYRCVFCGFIYYRSGMLELFWAEHRLHQPACAFIHPHHPEHQNFTALNIPLATPNNEAGHIEVVIIDDNSASGREDEDEDTDPGEDVVGIYPLNHPEQTIQIDYPTPLIDQVRNNRRFPSIPRIRERRDPILSRRDRTREVTYPRHTTSRRRFRAPTHPAMRSITERVNSFRGWPAEEVITANELAEAGFFYTGIFDHARCYHCNLTLDQWESGDNAWVCHAYYSPACPYVYLKRGRAFSTGIHTPTDLVLPPNDIPEPSKDIDRYTCKICMEKEIGTVFAPCDHAVSCISCTLEIEKCPICNLNLTHVIRLKMID